MSEDVAAAVRELFQQEEMGGQPFTAEDVLLTKGGGKYQLDLWKTNEAIFRAAGVKSENIHVTDICTCCHADWMFSHRASGGKRGNLSMFVVLNEERKDQCEITTCSSGTFVEPCFGKNRKYRKSQFFSSENNDADGF